MKNLAALIFLFLLLNVGVYGQKYFPFPTTNAYWNVYLLSTCDNDKPPDTFLLSYTIHGDTTIKQLNYKKICLVEGDTSFHKYKSVGGIREVDKKIYYIGENFLGMSDGSREYLLYDFNKQIGDSVKHYGYRSLNSVILDIDSMKIGEEYRKRYIVDCWGYHDPDYIVEGIGSILNGLLGHITAVPTCGIHYWEHICYWENGQILYFNPTFVDCFSPKLRVTTIEKAEISSIKIYPSPFSNEFQIDNIPTDKICSVKIYDSMGKIIYQDVLTKENEKINIKGSVGLYYVILINKNGQIHNAKKIIKD